MFMVVVLQSMMVYTIVTYSVIYDVVC
jgi:hypothetical protein